MTYVQIPISELPAHLAAGWRLRYICAGGLRVNGDAAIVERAHE